MAVIERIGSSQARPYVVAWGRLTEEDEDRLRTRVAAPADTDVTVDLCEVEEVTAEGCVAIKNVAEDMGCRGQTMVVLYLPDREATRSLERTGLLDHGGIVLSPPLPFGEYISTRRKGHVEDRLLPLKETGPRQISRADPGVTPYRGAAEAVVVGFRRRRRSVDKGQRWMALEDQFDPMPQEPADLIQRDDTGPILFWILKRLRASPRELDDFRFGHRRLFPKTAERLEHPAERSDGTGSA